MRLIKGTIICFMLLLQMNTARAQEEEKGDPIKIHLSALGGISYTGANAFLTISGTYKYHTVYIGPKVVASKSFVPGRIMWGGNIGYSYCILGDDKWKAFLNADYQISQYRNPGVLKATNIHEITGGLALKFFPVPEKFSFDLALGSGVHLEKSYNLYGVNRKPISGMMQQVRLGITYKISK